MPVDPPPARVLNVAAEFWSRAGQKHWLPVAGTSMAPFLNEGDEVLVAHKAGALRRGDVVVIRQDERLMVHRVLVPARAGDPAAILTQGDHNRQPDLPVIGSTLLGRVCAVRRQGREHAIETAGWRAAGWLIATSQLALNPLNTIDYVDAATKRVGRGHAEAIRLFLIPGMTHCGGGAAATDFWDSNAAMEKWLDTGVPPDRIEAVKIVDGNIVRRRPLCAHPRIALYTGPSGSDDLSKFECRLP